MLNVWCCCAAPAPSLAAVAPAEAGVAREAPIIASSKLVWPSFKQMLAPAESAPAESAPTPAAKLAGHSLRSLKVISVASHDSLLSWQMSAI